MFCLLGESRLCKEIKKSQFIATCVPIESESDVKEALSRLHHADATHNCWAWRLGERYRFSDDGEPGGSAGRPMLSAIDGQSFDGVLAHVVRYFGGIKLGVGGLVRAYGNTVAECLRSAEKKEIVLRAPLKFCVDFSDTYAVYGILEPPKCIKIDETYTADGVQFEVSVEADEVLNYRERLTSLTRARIRWLDET